jgi:hypothetical protein
VWDVLSGLSLVEAKRTSGTRLDSIVSKIPNTYQAKIKINKIEWLISKITPILQMQNKLLATKKDKLPFIAQNLLIFFTNQHCAVFGRKLNCNKNCTYKIKTTHKKSAQFKIRYIKNIVNDNVFLNQALEK